jgi:hypothetical protein
MSMLPTPQIKEYFRFDDCGARLIVKAVIEDGGRVDLALECDPEYVRDQEGGTLVRRTVVSSNSNLYPQPGRKEYGWPAFCFEFLCGVVPIAWYLLAFAERTTLRGLTGLEKIAASRPNGYLEQGKASQVVFQDEVS